MNQEIVKQLEQELKISEIYINRVLELLKDENTIAFIARYRQDYTNGLDENQIKYISDRYEYVLKLEDRKQAIIKSLTEKEILTPELENSINQATKLVELENIYKPYSTGRKTRANIAIEKGLKPLADFLLKLKVKADFKKEVEKYINKEKNVNSYEEALDGAQDIIAEIVSNDTNSRNSWIDLIYNHGKIVTKLKNAEADTENKYQIYYDFSKPIKFLQGYQIMAIDRISSKKIISYSFEYKSEYLTDFLVNKYTKKVEWEGKIYIENGVKSGLKRLLIPSVENQVYSEILLKAHETSAQIFANNLTKLLLQKPIKNKIVLGWDPAYRTGCKLAVVDKNNKVLKIDVIYPTKPRDKNDLQLSETTLLNLIKEYKIDLIAIGNGTASWESTQFVAQLIKKHQLNVQFIITSESGASIYSASENAQKEFPDLSVEQRSAINIARRNIDPLAELIKIDPKSIGVGQYQHDISKKMLKEKLDFAVSSCVNKVGVEINTASAELLTHISGLNLTIAKNIVNYINKNKMIKNRKELLNIKSFNEKIYQQAAGFLRVNDSDEFLDKTSIHPEMYENAYKILKHLNINEFNLEKLNKINLNSENIEKISKELKIDFYETKLILENFQNPLRDYRDDLDDPILRNDIVNFEDLQIKMKFKGIVRNITEFGAFIEIGLKDDAFLHISKFTKELMINDIIDVEIESINKTNGKIAVDLVKQ
ncbi:Tex-like N-terminal domain-containing protein [Mesomycoplasma lagogenitalium]|uniref:Tex-like N-terminal domain-containing protein n=1 Tax=Mesomycoplasma lagogenitalium TaxID=171286 RepID=A0ABY8LUF4_9BACT|nr:Tex-like N-terminal domain-containing protein [Mesomycoplasma lagogenitalium]WGI36345.1 Tex-like N-terminal domain-containing protein [Mesomycoplasma lagogenitalium]